MHNLIRLVTVALLLSSWLKFVDVSPSLNDDDYTFPVGVKLKNGQYFDYIVAGAGAAGSAAAARLALAGHDVLLIEAGGDPNILTKIPSASSALMGSDLDWQYKTLTNNVSCLASDDHQCYFSRGKCLGGSTSINYMIYTRGNRKDFDKIKSSGWTFDDIMPYFLRFEGLQDLSKLPPSSRYYHNTTGPMRVGFVDDSQNPWHSRLIKGFRYLQFPFNEDVNAVSQIGVTQVTPYVYKGERMSTARGYLTREDVKNTLKVGKNTRCTGVIIDKNKIALGVTAIQSFRKLKLYARKEVILSAGTIGTPQILMLSGIGPANHLKSMGIPVKVDLPVGEGMTDHVQPLLVLQVKQDLGPLGKIELLTSKIPQLVDLLSANRGAFTSIGLTDISVFVNTHCYDFEQRRLVNVSADGSDCEVPNLQIIPAYLERNLVPLAKQRLKKSTGLNYDVINQLSDANEYVGFIMMQPVLLDPYSVGTVKLASKDPMAPPAIFPNYLGDNRDVEQLVRSIGIIEHLAETHTFIRRNASLLRLDLPGCPRHEVDEQNYLRCYIRHMTFSVYHATGTVQLDRVLDARLRVFGIKRLRVADLSVLPKVPRANTEAVTIAIGERVAEFVLEDNKYLKSSTPAQFNNNKST